MSLATITWPHVSVAATTLDLVLNHQDSVATMNSSGIARFGASFTLSAPSQTTVQAVLYPSLVGTSQLIGVASGIGPGTPPLGTSNTIQLACTKGDVASVTLVLQSGQQAVGKGPCNAAPLDLHLSCTKSYCDGVYPIHYVASRGQQQSSVWALVTISNGQVLHPVDVVPLLTIDAGALSKPLRLESLLRVLATHPTSPMTIATNYQALERITIAPRSVRKALRLALESPMHRVVATPSTGIDFGQLSANGLDSQVQQQLNLTNEFLYSATSRNLDAPLYLRGTTSVASLNALAKAGVQSAVIAETSMVTPPSQTYTWGSPFRLAQTPAITAIPTFGPINQLMDLAGLSPASRANAILALISFLHFEAPNFSTARSVVAPLNARSADPQFLSEFLTGLGENRIISPAQLSTVLSSTRIGANGASTSQYVLDASTIPWSQNSIAYLDQLITEVSSFNQSIVDPWLSLTLMERLANAEQSGPPEVVNAALTRVGLSLSHQFKLLSIDPSSITLTSRHTSIPITLLSKAHYPMTVQIHLVAGGLTFPKAPVQLITIHSPTKSLRIAAVDTRGSSLTLRVNVLTRDGQFVITHEVIQVRFAGASLAGYLLTFFSALVLALWWGRTTWRRHKEQRQRR